MFTREEYVDWKQSKVTRELINGLKTERFGLQEAIAEGRTSGVETERTVGQCQGLRWAVEFVLEGMRELITDKGEHEDGEVQR